MVSENLKFIYFPHNFILSWHRHYSLRCFNFCVQDGFSAIAHIFKFLWRHMLRDIENVYRLFRTLPPLHRPPLPLPLPLLYAFHPSPPPPSLPPPQSLFRAPGSVAEIAHTTVCCRKLWISPQKGLSIEYTFDIVNQNRKTFSVRLETRRSFWE